jgi:HAMP domain-containing protein
VFTGGAWAVAAAAIRNATIQAFFPAEQYLGMRVEMDAGAGAEPTDTTGEAFQRLYAARVRELEHEIAENAAVAGVTLVRRLPVKARGTAPIEVDEGGSAPLARGRLGHATYSDAVDLDFFEVFGAPVLSGRGFDARDLADDVNGVVVNASFVRDVLGGRSAPGRRIRYVGRGADGEPGPWHEIVGVVGDLVADQIVTQGFESPPRARVYHPLDPARAGTYPVYVVAHVSGDPAGVAATLYPAAEGVSPALRLHEVATLDRAEPEIALMWRLFAYVVGGVSGVALVLSLAGIYAVMSFTVARRTREIGVRVALGAPAGRVTAEIFRKPLLQIGAGVLSGCVLMGVVVWSMTDGRVAARDGALLLTLGISVLAVCALACVTPVLRALRVEPTVALTAET